MAKILFYAHDPGGANAINPLIKPLSEKHQVFVYGNAAALNIFQNASQYSSDSDKLIEEIMPDFVVTGTSASCLFEKKLRKSAKAKNIPTMSILDHWANYGIRFSKYSTDELDKYNNNKSFDYLSDYIIVMDEYAKQQMILEGIPSKNIYALGNPHFEAVKKEFENINSDKLRKELLGDKEKLVVWGSEPYIEDYGFGMELECLKDVAELIPPDWQFVIKPHPRESLEKFKDFKNIKIANDVNSRQIIKASDIVMSMTSMFLIEAIIAAKPAISYQKNEINKDKFILTKIGALPFINDKIELEKLFEKPLNKTNFKIKFDAKDKITEFIEEILCQN